ncbi:MAG: ABC transporter [Spirochaetes bacterium]|nr:MAG: ABC transporter [Spirochaetota bacterium]
MLREIIKIDSISYSYPEGVQALKDVSLSVNEGEFLGIIGQNGAGKSTLLKCIVGLLKPQKGRILLKGEDLDDFPVSRVALKVGFVLQNPDLQLFSMTVRDEIAFGLSNMGFEREQMETRIKEALEMVGLSGREEEYPLTLSRGERARVVIASVIAMNPDIMILDEPTSGQDYSGSIQIMEIADKLCRDGRTILVVSHNMSLIAEYCRRVVVFRSGKIFLDGSVGEVFSRPDELIKTGIKPPQITRLGNALRDVLPSAETILRVEQLGDLIIEKVNRRR